MPSASMFIAIDGGAEKLAGRHEASKTAIAESVLGAFFPDAQDVRSDVVGQQFVPNVNALLAADPDVVFQWATSREVVVSPLTPVGRHAAGPALGQQEPPARWVRRKEWKRVGWGTGGCVRVRVGG